MTTIITIIKQYIIIIPIAVAILWIVTGLVKLFIQYLVENDNRTYRAYKEINHAANVNAVGLTLLAIVVLPFFLLPH